MIFCCIKQIACHHLLIMELLIDYNRLIADRFYVLSSINKLAL